jgi:hypothetical protein
LKFRLFHEPDGFVVPFSVKLDIQGSLGGMAMGWVELSEGGEHIRSQAAAAAAAAGT